MNKFRSVLTVLSVLAGCSLCAQQAEEPVVMQTVEAVLLEIGKSLPQLYYKGEDDEFKRFQYAVQRRGSTNEQVLSSSLELYREGVNEEGVRVMLPFMRMSIPRSTRVLVLLYGDANSQAAYKVYDDAYGVHESNVGRLINLTDRRAAFRLADDNVMVPPGGSQEFSGPLLEGERFFPFAFAMEGQESKRDTVSVRRFRMPSEKMRFTAIVAYKDFEVQGATGELVVDRRPTVLRFYDLPPDPPPPPPQAG